MPNNGHDVAVPARLGTNNAEAVIDIMVSNPLNDAGQDFPG
jgi:hypothetical protein